MTEFHFLKNYLSALILLAISYQDLTEEHIFKMSNYVFLEV